MDQQAAGSTARQMKAPRSRHFSVSADLHRGRQTRSAHTPATELHRDPRAQFPDLRFRDRLSRRRHRRGLRVGISHVLKNPAAFQMTGKHPVCRTDEAGQRAGVGKREHWGKVIRFVAVDAIRFGHRTPAGERSGRPPPPPATASRLSTTACGSTGPGSESHRGIGNARCRNFSLSAA